MFKRLLFFFLFTGSAYGQFNVSDFGEKFGWLEADTLWIIDSTHIYRYTDSLWYRRNLTSTPVNLMRQPYAAGRLVNVRESDGSPSVNSVDSLQFSATNFTLTNPSNQRVLVNTIQDIHTGATNFTVAGATLSGLTTDGGIVTNNSSGSLSSSSQFVYDAVGNILHIGTGPVASARMILYNGSGHSAVLRSEDLTSQLVFQFPDTAGTLATQQHVGTFYPLKTVTLTAADGVHGGGDLSAGRSFDVAPDFDGGLETVDDSLNVKLFGTTLTKSSSGLSADTSVLATQYDLTLLQPLDADLTTIAGLTATTDNFIVSVSSAWASRTPAEVRTTLSVPIFDLTDPGATNIFPKWDDTGNEVDWESNTTFRTSLGLGTGDSPTLTNLSLSARTSGRVAYFTTSGAFTDDADLTFDGTTLSILSGGNPAIKIASTSELRFTAGASDNAFFFYKDATPTKAVAWGMGIGSVTDDLIAQTYTSAGGGWIERMRIANSAGAITMIQPTIGNLVTTFKSTATNDDPSLNLYQHRLATTGSTTTTLLTYPVVASTAYIATVEVVARRTGGASGTSGDYGVYKGTVGFRNEAGTVTVNGVATAIDIPVIYENVAGYTVDVIQSGTNILVRATGIATTNITWHLTKFEVAGVNQ